jgi:hypothetical protein
MSVLDMFASALAAFMMCAIILMPFYKKDVTAELAAAQKLLKEKTSALEQLETKKRGKEEVLRREERELDKIQETKRTLEICHEGLNKCQVELAKTFILVKITWSAPVGLNLIVTDEQGNRFSWNKTNRTGRDFPNTKAKLSVSVTTGSGIQSWLDPDAKPGSYKIEYELTRDPNTDVQVDGVLYDRYGKKALPPHKLRDGKLHVTAAILELSAEGTLTVH